MRGSKLTHLSLCSGIGGLDLAAEWAGFKTVAQCEIDEYASKVLAKNFTGGVVNLHDIRTVTNSRLIEHRIDPAGITVISAGFPCQPYSLAGKGRGDRDERDLWGEVARVLGEVKPKWFVGENTPGLFSRENQRYFRRILSDLTALGYRVGWGIWGAYSVGAPHKRDRVFIMAHAHGKRRDILEQTKRTACTAVGEPKAKAPFGTGSVYGEISYPLRERRLDEQSEFNATEEREQTFSNAIKLCRKISYSDSFATCGLPCGETAAHSEFGKLCEHVSDAANNELGVFGSTGKTKQIEEQRKDFRGRMQEHVGGEWWKVEPDVGRVAHGVSSRVDKLRCLGNAVVPYQAYPIFKAIAAHELEQN